MISVFKKRLINRLIFLVSVIFFSILANASGNDTPNTIWECRANDSLYVSWIGNGNYQKMAAGKAFESCKKQSQLPHSCAIVADSCEVYVHGKTTHALWRCTALDQLSKTWRSSIFSHRDDAALAAKDYCYQESDMPDTCYINLLMCRNLANLS
jgi:hypothetical protein